MLHDPSRLEGALAPLVGLPLWTSHRAADLQVFQFGDKRTVTSNFGPRKGQELAVGEYGLHIQCAWRIRGPSGIVVASRDRFYKAGPEPFPEDDWTGALGRIAATNEFATGSAPVRTMWNESARMRPVGSCSRWPAASRWTCSQTTRWTASTANIGACFVQVISVLTLLSAAAESTNESSHGIELLPSGLNRWIRRGAARSSRSAG